MEIGIFKICMPIFIFFPEYNPKNVLNIVIAKTSSIEAPANMRVGIP